jgi:hypothetical protein
MAATEVTCFHLCGQAEQGLGFPSKLEPSPLFEHSPPRS